MLYTAVMYLKGYKRYLSSSIKYHEHVKFFQTENFEQAVLWMKTWNTKTDADIDHFKLIGIKGVNIKRENPMIN